MMRVGGYVFKRAETEEEFGQIHCLNYRTFVTEIPQHTDPGCDRLVDKFHDKSIYFVAKEEGRVIAMLSSHDQPPFSVADRLPDPSVLRRAGTRPLEVRLLAVEPAKRNSTIFFGLLWVLYDHALTHHYTHLYISGFTERVPLYERLGFQAMGPGVKCGAATFVPMVLNVGNLPEKINRIKRLWETHVDLESSNSTNGCMNEVCLLPGPVAVGPNVQHAFHQPMIYHRGPEFLTLFRRVRRTLGDLVGGKEVALFNGSGTLANEVIAATIAASPGSGRGVLLINGEFGERLARQTARFGLEPRILRWPWGRPWDIDEVAGALAKEPADSWVWGVHQESSTGVVNDLPALTQVSRAHGIRVCVDCVSSLGAVPLDLRDIYLASGASGKSLGSYAGLAIVFASSKSLTAVDMGRVPSYFDVSAALASDGPRYTFPSSTVHSLDAALSEYASAEKAIARYTQYAALGKFVRSELRRLGLAPIAADEWASPVITTFAPPEGETSQSLVAQCMAWGYAIGGHSQYLLERRLVQVATMGAVTREDCSGLFKRLGRWLKMRRRETTSTSARATASAAV